MHQTGFKNKAGRTQDFPFYTQERIILDMQNKDIQLSDITNEEEERGSAGPEKGTPTGQQRQRKGNWRVADILRKRRQRHRQKAKKIPDPERTGETKTATTYSPTCTQYHRRDEA